MDKINRNKKPPLIPRQSNDEEAKEQKRVILASLKWGGGVVQDCWYVYIGNNLSGSVLKRHLRHCKGKSCETIFWRRKETKILENLCHPKFLRGFHDKSANFLSSFCAPPSLSLEHLGRVLLGSTVSGWLGWLGWLNCFVFYWKKNVFGSNG